MPQIERQLKEITQLWEHKIEEVKRLRRMHRGNPKDPHIKQILTNADKERDRYLKSKNKIKEQLDQKVKANKSNYQEFKKIQLDELNIFLRMEVEKSCTVVWLIYFVMIS